MKKFLYILITVFILTFTFGCSNVDEKPEKPSLYEATVTSTEIIVDYDGTLLLAVTIKWTNNSEDTINYLNKIGCQCFQDGVELKKEYYVNEEQYPILTENYLRRNSNIRPGVSTEVTDFFKIRNTESPIEIEVKEHVSFNKKLLDETLYDFAN